jgi:quaternary ammonium compound-resistance protein SugE
MMAWFFLVAAGVFEIGFTTCLKLSDGFTKLWPSLGFLAFSCVSFGLLTVAMRSIPLGTAYAVWTGIGAFGTAVVGMVAFGDPVGLWRVVLLSTILLSIVGLKLISAN